MKTAYRLGTLGFTLAGSHPVAAHLRDEFLPLAVAEDTTSQLDFEFAHSLQPLAGASYLSPLRISDDGYEADLGGITHQVRVSDGVIRVAVRPDQLSWRQRRIPGALRRAMDWNHLTPHETMAKNFVYGVFDYLSQIAQLPLRQSHLHASSFERDGCGVAIIAWGGVGKTTTMLKMIMESGWRFLSDDLVTIDADGVLWRSPKRMQIYGYNIEGQQRLRDALLRGRSVTDRAAWAGRLRLRGPRAVRRRVSAEHLLGAASVATHARLAHALFIDRVDAADFSAAPMSADDLAHRAATTLLRELQPFVDYSAAIHSAGRRLVPSVQELHAASRDVLQQAFAGVQPHAVTLPLRADPDAVSAYMNRLLDLLNRHAAS